MLLVLGQGRQQLQDEAGSAARAVLQLTDQQLEAACRKQRTNNLLHGLALTS
jgi:hypothetical protein